jgi:serine phosphatase RsbU (regulator of sigma subunit)
MKLRNLTLRQFGALSSIMLLMVGVIVIAGYLVTGSRVTLIRDAWTDLQATRSERSTLETALTASLGYGGMIHNFKNFILRKSPEFMERARGDLGAARFLIGRYGALGVDPSERKALDTIADTLKNYEKALGKASRLIVDQVEAMEIDRHVQIDDSHALKAITLLQKINEEHYEKLEVKAGKPILTARLRSVLGYGGLIHAFKNYILRRDEKYAAVVNAKVDEVGEILSQFRKLDISTNEALALANIEKTAVLYRREVLTVRNLMAASRASENIDQAVAIDDSPAFLSLEMLDRQIILDNDYRDQEMSRSLNFLEDTGILVVGIICIVLAVLLVASGWLLRRLVTKPVGEMTTVMSDLAAGDFALEVPGTELSNEIGEMARAVAVFRENAVERLVAEKELSSAHDLITESVQYASRIQRSLLPPEDILSTAVDDHFIIWEPKDVVGGDLFWVKRDKKGCMIVLFDCTGHGVPGALMTTIAVSAIDHAFDETGDPARLIRQVHQRVKIALNQDGDEGFSDDGLEMGVCLVERERKRLTFAGARFELLIRHNGEMEIIKGQKAGCGYRRYPLDQAFTNHIVKLQPGMMFTMFSDGATDQIGGQKRRMFGKKRLCQTLNDLANKPMAEQGEGLRAALAAYQGEESRRDDLSVIGFKPIS